MSNQNKEMIISASAHEKKVAILENGSLTEFYVERTDDLRAVVGNVYKGRVMKVLPGMQSAFVDIGLERDAFLYVSDFFDEEDSEEFETTTVSVPSQQPQPARPPKPGMPPPQREARPERDPRRGGRDRDRRPAPPLSAAKPSAVTAELAAPEPVEGPQEITAELVSEMPGILEGVLPEEIVELDGDELNAVLEAEEEAHLERAEPAVTETPALSEAVPPQTDLATLLKMAGDHSFERITDHDLPANEPKPLPSSEPMIAHTSSEPASAEAAEPVSAEPVAEAEPEESAKPTRKRRSKKAEPEPVVEKVVEPARKKPARGRKKTAEPVAAAPAPAPAFERILDDEVLSEAGDMLKEAIVQQKIMAQTREAEYETVTETEPAPPAEPEPEVRVGSLRGHLAAESAFERVEDQGHPAEPAAAGAIGAEPSEAPATETAPAEGEDSEASIEARPRHPEFASRRGRRGRGRRVRPSGGPAGAGTEEGEGEQPLNEEESAALFGVDLDGNESDGKAAVESLAADAGEDEVSEPPAPAPAPPPAQPAIPQPARPPQRERDARPQRDPRASGRPPGITDLLREGQEILVQIAKEPIGLKGARITSYIALPGRYLVYMPTVNHVGVSRKIPSEQERTRLKRTMHTLCEREQIPGGFIVRTACEGHTDEELLEDMLYLYRTWQDMRKRSEHARAGTVIYRELDLVQRQLRDHMSSDFSAIRVDNEEEYTRVVDFINRFQPKLVNRVKLYMRKRPIFEEYGIQPEIDAAIRPRVWLKSGGFIVINQTEALVAIDVNTGKFVGRSNRLEDTIVKTNLEAAVEIVRQIRLRDLGGIIVLDFIDMEERRNRQKVMQVLEQELKSDRSPSKILQFNDFGLVAITRKRVRQSLEKTLCEPCQYCSGAGLVKSTQTMCYEILAEAKKMAIDWESKRVAEVTLRVNPAIARALRDEERQVFQEIEALVGCSVSVKADSSVHQEQFDFAVV